MQDLRSLAANDAVDIIQYSGTPILLIDGENEYYVMANYGDIGKLVNPISGETVQGRAIEATITEKSIKKLAGKIPAKGWKAKLKGLDGKELNLFVQRCMPDRTIGMCNLTLGLKLEGGKNE